VRGNSGTIELIGKTTIKMPQEDLDAIKAKKEDFLNTQYMTVDEVKQIEGGDMLLEQMKNSGILLRMLYHIILRMLYI
jgi:hypothetical protein